MPNCSAGSIDTAADGRVWTPPGRTVLIVDDASPPAPPPGPRPWSPRQGAQTNGPRRTDRRARHPRLAGTVADEVVCLSRPDFMAVGQGYDDFGQTTDEEVCALLAAAPASGPGRKPASRLKP